MKLQHLLLWLVLAILLGVWQSFIIVKLWAWFVVPSCSFLDGLNIKTVMGLGLLWEIITYKDKKPEDKEMNKVVARIVTSSVVFGLLFLLGYLIHLL